MTTTTIEETATKRKSGKRGFASMTPERRREIARRGALALHQSGKAHRWDSEQAGLAGRVGGKWKRTPKGEGEHE